VLSNVAFYVLNIIFGGSHCETGALKSRERAVLRRRPRQHYLVKTQSRQHFDAAANKSVYVPLVL